MNSNDGGKDSREAKQREAAANIARQKVFDAYKTGGDGGSGVGETGKLKDENIRVSREQWMKYHTAWQDYYQKYYSEYYANAARDLVAKERLKETMTKAAAELEDDKAVREKTEKKNKEAPMNVPTNGRATELDSDEIQTIVSESVATRLKNKIREKASDERVKSRKRRKFMPVVAGVVVVLVFLFLQYNRLIFAPIMAYVSPGETPASSIEAVDPTVSNEVGDEPKLIIPKINVDVPVAFGLSSDEVNGAMRVGVAHFRVAGASAFPGEIGNTVISGHSAGDVYNSDPYKFIFSGLTRLSEGDLMYVNYKGVRYTYKVVGFQTVEPTDVGALIYTTDKPMLTLVTCTPLGTSKYRLLVSAEQISPSYENAPSAEPVIGGGASGGEISGEVSGDSSESFSESTANTKTFFQRVWAWLTGDTR